MSPKLKYMKIEDRFMAFVLSYEFAAHRDFVNSGLELSECDLIVY